MTTEFLTYDEIGWRLGIKSDSARKLVRREKWPRETGDDGLTRAHVPAAALTIREPREEPQIGKIIDLERRKAAAAVARADALERRLTDIEGRLKAVEEFREAGRKFIAWLL